MRYEAATFTTRVRFPPCSPRHRSSIGEYALDMHVTVERNHAGAPQKGVNMTVMMACGHAANSTRRLPDGTTQPACVICAGFDPRSSIVVGEPDLTGRRARCFYYGTAPRQNECRTCTRGVPCSCEVDSNMRLAFFGYHPDKAFDEFYCGCQSWN